MRKITLLFTLSMLVGCSKHDSTSYPGGSWAFQSANYNVVSCIATVDINGILDNLTASDKALPAGANSGATVVDCYFGSTLPLTPGSYVVIPGNTIPTSANQVAINYSIFNSSRISYLSTGGN